MFFLSILLACTNGSAPSDADADTDSDTDTDTDTTCEAPEDVTFDAGCLTFDGASQVCGFASDDTMCELTIACGFHANQSDCEIACEMETMFGCIDETTVDAAVEATCAQDCDALRDSFWAIFE